MARIRDEDGLFELTEEDLKKLAVGDDSPFYQMNDTLPEKPLGFKFDEYPEECISNSIFPLMVSKRHPVLYRKIEDLATVAVKKFFGPDGIERPINAILEVNAGGTQQCSYYITFAVDNDGTDELFQAEVYETSNGTFNVPHCKHKI